MISPLVECETKFNLKKSLIDHFKNPTSYKNFIQVRLLIKISFAAKFAAKFAANIETSKIIGKLRGVLYAFSTDVSTIVLTHSNSGFCSFLA
jgi:hypothetical protein